MAQDTDHVASPAEGVSDSDTEKKPKSDFDAISALVSESENPAGREVSVSTIARMMGLATSTDLKLLGSKLDLLIGRVNAMTARMERIVNTLSNAPTGSDLERIDVQVGSLKTLIRDGFTRLNNGGGASLVKADKTESSNDSGIAARKKEQL